MTIGLLASQAAKAYFEAITPAIFEGLNYYAAIEDPDDDTGNSANPETPPCVTFWATDAQEYPTGSGNWNLMLHARVTASGASAEDLSAEDFDELYDAVFGKLYTDTICSDLSAAKGDFHCFGLHSEPQQGNPGYDKDSNRTIEFVLPINCCPSDIATT